MNRIIISCVTLGILFIIMSFLKINETSQSSNYTESRFKRFIRFIINNKIIALLSSDTSKSNIKLIDKLKVIIQCRRSEKLYKNVKGTRSYNKEIKKVDSSEALKTVNFIRIVVACITIVLCFFMKMTLNNMVVEQTLNKDTIYKQVNYKINREDISSILTYMDGSYKSYINEGNIEGLADKIKLYSKRNMMSIDNDSIKKMCEIYLNAYNEGKFILQDYILLAVFGFIANLIVVLYIDILYRIYKLKLFKEFNDVELITILHMNRDGLNIFEILSEVNKYTVYLNPYIRKCLNKYNSDPVGALEKLIKEVNDENFSSYVSVLISCLDKPKDINTEVLRLQRKIRYLNKRVDEDKNIEFKQLCLTIAQFPLITLFSINLIIPFLERMNSGNLLFF